MFSKKYSSLLIKIDAFSGITEPTVLTTNLKDLFCSTFRLLEIISNLNAAGFSKLVSYWTTLAKLFEITSEFPER